MKTLCLLLLLTIGASKTYAQHCPFDGGTVILIQLKNKAGKPVNDSLVQISLSETANPNADSCTYAAGLLQLPFTSIEKGWIGKYGNSWKNNAIHLLKDSKFKTEQGYRAVVINQAQTNCMIKNGNDFIYMERNYTIDVVHTNGTKESIVVPAKRKYALCTGSGKWSRIEAMEVVIE